ncbi:S1 RNA-binding domain-containing protein [Candidatus Poribacteria bacterium]|nr:S1 RNA-binding domain-containing protein [Candidatus Poribacteria bacterium]
MAEEFELEEETGGFDAEFEALLAQHMPEASPKTEGELFDATVDAVLEDAVLVNYGAKEESAVPIGEFLDPKGVPSVRPGDKVRVVLTGWDEDGAPEISYKMARAAEAEKMIEEALAHRVPVRGVVSRAVNGGVIVDIGIPSFMPASQADAFRLPDLGVLVGQEIEAYVLDYDPGRKRAVLSRRKLLEERREKTRGVFMETLKSGHTVKGVVRDVLDFGVFVTLGPIEGMIPRSELSYDRGVHPSAVVKQGQEIEVKILEISTDTGKVTLSRKRLNQDPWDVITETYPIGSTVSGKILTIQEFGAFVQLQEGITGLIHAKDMTWEAGQKKPSDMFREDDVVTCQVLEIDTAKKRLALSLKHLTRDPWMDIEAKYPVGSRHKGVVSSLRDFGAFVKLDEYTEGLVHISELSWEKRYNHPSELLQEGQPIEVMVLKLDRAQRRIGLGLRQLTDSPMQRFMNEHPAGSLVTGKVTRTASYGAFVEVAPGLEGMIHITELDNRRVESPDKVVRHGQEVAVKVLSIDPVKNRISLSLKQAVAQAERESIEQFSRQGGGGPVSVGLGDALRAAREKAEKKKR